ncbi:MAG: helix-turn-helix transcriptional regulator [Anaerolineae bacterium]|nr:helix-turn-helix transcriptional regulator [Anaerolineae bacterium]
MHGRHGHRGGGGRGAGYGRADHLLEPALLCSLQQGATHGYGLSEQLAEFGLESVPLRRVYRALQGLEGAGWVSSDWETSQTQGPPRRVYALTLEGRQLLHDWMAHLRESRAAIDRLLEAYERSNGRA